jgi:uroporphyrinogen-III synthase/uroporphyrinogen III methyltransferase/synthase
VCIVFAPSQVAALGDVAAMQTRFVAIGPTTAAALREAGIAEVAVAATPTPAGIANAVAAVYPPRR